MTEPVTIYIVIHKTMLNANRFFTTVEAAHAYVDDMVDKHTSLPASSWGIWELHEGRDFDAFIPKAWSDTWGSDVFAS